MHVAICSARDAGRGGMNRRRDISNREARRWEENSMRWLLIVTAALVLGGAGVRSQIASLPVAAQEATPSTTTLEEASVAEADSDRLTPVLASIIGRETAPVLATDGK